jgi:hypothetical protein
MMINKNILLAAFLLVLSGCASSPSDISPAMVDTSAYERMTCEGLLMAAKNEGVNLESVSKDQRSARNWDIALNTLNHSRPRCHDRRFRAASRRSQRAGARHSK